MGNNKKLTYESPHTDVVEVKFQGIICTSDPQNAGGENFIWLP